MSVIKADFIDFKLKDFLFTAETQRTQRFMIHFLHFLCELCVFAVDVHLFSRLYGYPHREDKNTNIFYSLHPRHCEKQHFLLVIARNEVPKQSKQEIATLLLIARNSLIDFIFL